MYTLDKRCQEILRSIVYANGYIKVQDIALQMGVSKRSAYYDINKIDEWLISRKIPVLEQKRGQGVRLNEDQKESIRKVVREYISAERIDPYQVFTPEERYHIEICSIIIGRHELYIEDFMEICDVSRNTIINDLKNVMMILQGYDLNLKYSIKSGYTITGDVIRKRAVFFLYFPALWTYYTHSIFTNREKEEIHAILKELKTMEHALHAEYVSGTLPTLATFISTIGQRKETLSFPDMDEQEIVETQEYALVDTTFPAMEPDEKIYISLHLLGSRLQAVPVRVMKEDKQHRLLATKLVREFEQLSSIYYDDVDELIDAITAHFMTSMYRYRYGIQLGNPLLENIKNEYSELFELTKNAYRCIQNDIGIMISDAEIGYLTLHFGAFITPNNIEKRPYRILIICPNGIGAGKMLKTEVATLVPQATEIINIPLGQYQKDHTYDVVISTVFLEEEKNLILVHPILTDQDRITILRKCMQTQPHDRMQIDEIMKIAQRYIPAERIDDFHTELQDYFASTRIHKAPVKNYGMGLRYYLRPDHIVTVSERLSWDEAIIKTCQPLLMADSITQDYIDAILYDQRSKGLYMFLTEGLVLAHTASENGVKHLDVSLAACNQPISFLNGRQAKIIISLCAEDQTKHIRILNDILELFSKKKNIEIISQFTKPLEVYEYIMSQLGEEK